MFVLLALMLLLLWISNHIYLQLFTSLFLLNVGIFTIALPFLEPYIFEARDLAFSKLEDEPLLQLFIVGFIQNPLLTEIIFFTLLFFIFFIVSMVSYLAFIKFKHHVSFSILSLKQNLWKLVYLPFFVLGLGFVSSLIVPVVGKQIAQESYFLKLVYALKMDKIIERKNYIPAAKTVFQSIDKLADKDVPIAERKKALLEVSSVALPAVLENKEIKKELKERLTAKEYKIVEQLSNPAIQTKDRKDKSAQLLQSIEKTNPEATTKMEEILNNDKFLNKVQEIQATSAFKEQSLSELSEQVGDQINTSQIDDLLTGNIEDVDKFLEDLS